MKIKIKSITEILNNKLSLVERGILITILLLKEDDPELTLAKFKSKVKISEIKGTLTKLHENNFIEWSGYKNAKKQISKEKLTPEVIEIIEFMNKLYGTKFNYKLDSVNTGLINRLQNNSAEDIKMVIANRYEEWKNDAFMRKYLTPYTIFRPSKFDKYLEEARRTKKGESIINAEIINLKNGEEITMEIASKLLPNQRYNIRVWTLNEDGKRSGNGNIASRKGQDILKSLVAQDRNQYYGNKKEFEYTYIAK